MVTSYPARGIPLPPFVSDTVTREQIYKTMTKNQAVWEFIAVDKISPAFKKLQGRMETIRKKTGVLLGKMRASSEQAY